MVAGGPECQIIGCEPGWIGTRWARADNDRSHRGPTGRTLGPSRMVLVRMHGRRHLARDDHDSAYERWRPALPARPPTPCTAPGCPELTDGGPCEWHARARRRQSDRQRGTTTERGYAGRRWVAARTATLLRDLICTCTANHPNHGPYCPSPSTIADHYPKTRRQLLAEGVADPDHPRYLRGLCKPCHDRHTAATSPGGWNRR